MSSVKLILNQEVANLGSLGAVVNVRAGYARNFLIPRGLAVLANEGNKAALAHHLKVLEKMRQKLLAEAKKLASAIEKTSLTISKQVGEEEKIFGTVTTAEITDLLNTDGMKVDKKDIVILEDIKKVGVYAAQVKINADVVAKFKIWVVAQS